MINSISNPLPSIKSIPSIQGFGENSEGTQKLNFADVLAQSLDQVNQIQNESNEMGKLFAAGKIDDLHTMMIEGEKADLALQFTLQIRNKILDAYNEIMRMNV